MASKELTGVENLRARLAAWERRVADLLGCPESAIRAQDARELVDRCETARIKVERAARASPARRGATLRDCATAFARLREAWNAAALHRSPAAMDSGSALPIITRNRA